VDDAGGGWLWLVVDVALVAMLGGALLYGYVRWRGNRKTPRQREREREAIKKLYEEDAK